MNEEKKISFFYNAITGETVRLENSDYINKDKIREKIEYVLEDITGEGEEAEYGARCLARKILELLEGDNNEHSKDNRKESR